MNARKLASLLLLLPILLGSVDAQAAGLKEKERGDYGITWWGSFKNAPFPAKGFSYKDDSIAIFVPKHFCPTQIRAKVKVKDKKGRVKSHHKTSCYSKSLEAEYKKNKVRYRVVQSNIDYVVHFHGHSNTIEKTFRNHKLREQFAVSLQNAILVVPQGPVNSVDSAAGKLESAGGFKKMMREVHGFLQDQGVVGKKQRIGNIILSSHSGGYRAVGNVLTKGGMEIRELFMFDSLYANLDDIFSWLKSDSGRKLINLYFREKPRARTADLMGMLDAAGIPYRNITEKQLKQGKFSRKDLYRNRIIMIATELGHSGCTNKYFNFRDYLYASCLNRYQKSDWFQQQGLDTFEQ